MLTLSLLAKAAGIEHESDRLSIAYKVLSEEAFREHVRKVASSEPDAIALAKLMPVKAVEKFDEFVPAALLDEANARNRLDIREACRACAAVK